tara:strand:+ start:6079 stop:7194 length:1116 start_codon:yes stop_codon:yes gene_type:complete
MLKNTASQHVSFIAIAVADGSAVTTGTPTVYLSLDGATQATSTSTATHLGHGVWILDLTQAETNADNLAAVMVLSTAINSFAQAFPYVLADFKANVSGLSTFDPTADTVANVTLVATTTTNTDMVGTNGANTVAPDNASITLILADTADLQANQGQWLTATGFNTIAPDNAGIAAIKVKTDQFAFTIANQVDANSITGSGDATAANQTAITNAIAALNDFDAAADTVSLVTTCSNNTDMRGTDSANTIAPDNTSIAAILVDSADLQANQGNWLTATGFNTTVPDNAGIAANGVAVAALNDFDPAVDPVAVVTLVATCTTNGDMRGTDSANTVAPDNAGITSLVASLATVPKLSTLYTHTAQSGDTIQVTIT